MEKKVYVGNGKKHPDFDMINISLKYDTLKPNEKWYVNLTVSANREADQFWNTHNVTENNWKPKAKTEDTAF